jgi:hypothetical protein
MQSELLGVDVKKDRVLILLFYPSITACQDQNHPWKGYWMKLMFGWLMRKPLCSIRLRCLGGSGSLGFDIVAGGRDCPFVKVCLDCCLEVVQAGRKDSSD